MDLLLMIDWVITWWYMVNKDLLFNYLMANFFLKIDKPFYFAGDVVTGHLLVNVVQPLQATGISLKFSGY